MSARSADFPDPLVRLVADLLEVGHQSHKAIPQLRRRGGAGAAPDVKGFYQFAIDVQLKLFVSCVSNANWLASFIASQPRKLYLWKPAFAGDAIQNLHVVWVACDRAKKPIAPGEGFVRVASKKQRVKSKGRVAQPAEAVVPVARTTDPSRQCRSGSGDDTAGGSISECFERYQRAQRQIAPWSRDRGS